MNSLSQLENTYRKRRTRKRVGRGFGSNGGKTCGRGEKGAGSRSGYKRRQTYEGGQARMFQKMPTRGFSRGRFREPLDVINLQQVDALFAEGDVVSLETLQERGFFSGPSYGIKLLANGELTKKLTFKVKAASQAAVAQVERLGGSLELI